jgi:cobyrinic acid a,c-diamide synthase
VPLAGVLFNRVAGTRHRDMLTAALARHLPELPCLGAVPRQSEMALEERHLGLVPAGEEIAAETAIARGAAAVSAHVDVERLVALARAAPSGAQPQRGSVGILPTCRLEAGAPEVLAPLGQRIAVARDDAFLFIYAAVLEGWRQRGAELSFFSPLADEPPDPATDAVYLPGGYPELHAGRIATAERFRTGLRQAATEGKAVYGECGGYMALGEALTDSDGRVHRMAGLLPLATSFAEHRLHLGYRNAVLLHDGPLGPAGSRFRGHEFHYATTLKVVGEAPLFTLRDALGNDLGTAGLKRGSVIGSFIHLIDRAGD